MKTRLVVMSDSHGDDDAVDSIILENPDADAYLHCGDLSSPENYHPELVLVKGNNDYFSNAPYERVLHFGGIKIYMCHSHKLYGYPARKALVRKAKEYGCALALYGHTHMYDDSEVDGVKVLNPGSCWHNRDGREPSYAIVDIEDGEIKIQRVVCFQGGPNRQQM